MAPARKHTDRSPLVVLCLVILTVIVAVVGIASVRIRRKHRAQTDGFATSEIVSQTEPAGKFADFDPVEPSIRYDPPSSSVHSEDTDIAVPETPQSSGTTSAAPTAPTAPTTADPTATIPTTTTSTSVTAVPASTQSITPTSIPAVTTSTTQPGSTVHNYSEGAAYAYAYAGFTPQQADLSISEWNLLLVNRNYILPQDYAPELA